MNNLVLGSAGFVGRYLCDYLRDKGETVFTFDMVGGQDCREETLPLKGIDRVYFLAWMVGGSNYLYDPKTQESQLEWNIKILSNVMPQLKDIPFVFISSQLAESDTIYGNLKKLGEHWTKLNNGVVVRLWNVYGAYEKSSKKSHVVADFIHQALKNNKIVMQTNGEEKRQFVYIEDVCDALYQSFEYKGVYDATSLKWNSVLDIAKLISKETGCELVIGNKVGSSLMIENKSLLPDFYPAFNIETGIEETVKLFRKQK